MWSFFSRDTSKVFPYEIGERVTDTDTALIWKLFKGRKKGSGEAVTVFTMDAKSVPSVELEIGKATLKRLKTLRLPGVLTYIDSHESDQGLQLVTEFVVPLCTVLQQLENQKRQERLHQISWGIFQVTRALNLLEDANLLHNNVNIYSIFVNAAGEWLLGGIEYVCPASERIVYPKKIQTVLQRYNPPEQSDSSGVYHGPQWACDSWGLGCLIWEAFNGPLPQTNSLSDMKQLPSSVLPLYCELVTADPSSRLSPRKMLQRGQMKGGFFTSSFIDALMFLEEIHLKEASEIGKFCTCLTNQLDSFPTSLCQYKILPQLLQSAEFGNAGANALAPILKLGDQLTEEEYQKKIVPCVVRLFTSDERSTRVRLLQQLDLFAVHLSSDLINNEIFPRITTGFSDNSPILRELSVKSVLPIAAKLNYQNLNVELLKHFARLQSTDDQGGIRTNTTICLGKIAGHLHPNIRQKVLISAFSRALKDQFSPARSAGIMALATTHQFYLLSDIASKILPILCSVTVDPDEEVRRKAFQTVKAFLGKLERASEDPSLRDELESTVHAGGNTSATASSWAGWAMSAVTSKFYRGQANHTVQVTDEKSSTTTPPPDTEKYDEKQNAIVESDDSWRTKDWINEHIKGNETCSDTLNEPGNPGEGWDCEEWVPLEDSVTPSNTLENNAITQHSALSTQPSSSYNWGDASDVLYNSLSAEKNETKALSSESAEWSSFNTVASDTADTSKHRNELRQQRKKEIQSKNASRNSGPLRLGIKKIG